MATTNLFTKYFNSGRSTYVVAPTVCSDAGSKDSVYAEFGDSKFIIGNDSEVLASLNLGDIKSPVSEYTNNNKTLNPNEGFFIPGTTNGPSFRAQYFKLPSYYNTSLIKDKFPENIQIDMDIIVNGEESSRIRLVGLPGESILDQLKELFKCSNSSINVTTEELEDISSDCAEDIAQGSKTLEECLSGIQNQNSNTKSLYLKFESTVSGYYFNIDNLQITERLQDGPNPDSPFTEPDSFIVPESYCRSVDAYKYPNGAYKGIMLKIGYPKFNDDDIADYRRYILLAHLKDKIDLYNPVKPVTFSVGEDFILDESSSPHFIPGEEVDLNIKTTLPVRLGLTDPTHAKFVRELDGNSDIKIDLSYENLEAPTRDQNIMSLIGYMEYVTRRDEWINVGEFYGIMGSEDSAFTSSKNLISPVVIFNPHDYPIKISYVLYT